MNTNSIYKLSKKILKENFPNEPEPLYESQNFNSINKTLSNIEANFLFFFKNNFFYSIDFFKYPKKERIQLLEAFYHYSQKYNSKFLDSICKINLDGEEIFKFKNFYLDFFQKNVSKNNLDFLDAKILNDFSHREIMLSKNYSLDEKFKKIKIKLNCLHTISSTPECLYKLEDIGSEIIIQSLIKLISKENIYSESDRINILKNFDQFLKEYNSNIIEKPIIRKYTSSSNLILDFFNLILFIEKTIYLKGYLEIYSILESDFKDSIYFLIPDSARSNRRYISDDKNIYLQDEELYFLVNFLEHPDFFTKENLAIFKRNKSIIETLIFIFRNKHNRKLSEKYLQHFRGVYNEVCNSTLKINRKTIFTIAKQFITNYVFSSDEIIHIKKSFPETYLSFKDFFKSEKKLNYFKRIFFQNENNFKYTIDQKIFLFSLLKLYDYSSKENNSDFKCGLSRKEYMFLREKLSRGMYLEREEFEEYFLKNSIQKTLTQIVLKKYTINDISSTKQELINTYIYCFDTLKELTSNQ